MQPNMPAISTLSAARSAGYTMLDIEQVIRDLEIDLQFHDCFDHGLIAHLYQTMGPQIEGASPRRWVLEVNARMPEHMRRFTMARMLAHRLYATSRLVLADQSAYSTTDTRAFCKLAGDPRSDNALREEDERLASKIAVTLLFPEKLMRTLHSYGLTTEEMAQDLISTKLQIEIRLKTLQLTAN